MFVSGGSFRTVGRSDQFTLEAVANTAGIGLRFSWACVDESSGVTISE